MAEPIDAILDRLIKREGGFVNHGNDRGGPTNMGITQRTLSGYLGHRASVEEVRNLSYDSALEIYRQEFYITPGFDCIQDPVLLDLLVDSGVNHGWLRAVKWLQRAVEVKDDGIIGYITRAALAQHESASVYRSVLKSRIQFYGDLVYNNYQSRKHGADFRDQSVFMAGWCRRLCEFIEIMPPLTGLDDESACWAGRKKLMDRLMAFGWRLTDNAKARARGKTAVDYSGEARSQMYLIGLSVSVLE